MIEVYYVPLTATGQTNDGEEPALYGQNRTFLNGHLLTRLLTYPLKPTLNAIAEIQYTITRTELSDAQ